MTGPMQRFLGVREDASPFELLGLRIDQCEPGQIQRALQMKLGRVIKHPDGQSDEGRIVQERLRKAAEVLRDPARRGDASRELTKAKEWPQPRSPEDPVRPDIGGAASTQPPSGPVDDPIRSDVASAPRSAPARRVPGGEEQTPRRGQPRRRPQRLSVPRQPPRIQMTPFDRHVLAVLVGLGGWNARSRAKLVAIAASHGVSPQGLLKVITGLGQYARAGGARLDVQTITKGKARFEDDAETNAFDEPQLKEASIPAISTEHFRDAKATTFKLSLLFGALTVLLGVGFVQMLIARPDPVTSLRQPDMPESAAQLAPPPVDTGIETLEEPGRTLLAQYSTPPTFRGEASPSAAVEAADRCARVPDEIDTIIRKLTVNETMSIPTAREWRAALQIASVGWLMTDHVIHDDTIRKIEEVFFAVSNRPSVADELLQDIASVPVEEGPLGIVRSAWIAGALGDLAGRRDLPAAVSQRAAELLADRFGEQAASADLSFAVAARRVLNKRLPDLVAAIEFDPLVYDRWELWLRTHERLGQDEAFYASILDAMRHVLITPTDLGTPGPSVDVLGRLLSEADFKTSEAVRDGYLALFEEPDITARDLWVVGSLLATFSTAPWHTQELVLDPHATRDERFRTRGLIRDAWPDLEQVQVLRGSGVLVDLHAGQSWRETLDALINLHEVNSRVALGEPRIWLNEAVIAAQLNKAALMLTKAQDRDAEELLSFIESAILASDAGDIHQQLPPVLRLSPSGPDEGLTPPPLVNPDNVRANDGQWTAEYEAARRDYDAKLGLLQSLRSQAFGDLGEIDAARFVHEVYRGSGAELRSIAHTVLLEMFGRGSNVALEMLNQFSEAPRTQATSDVVGQFTGAVLPAVRSEAWAFEARRALVDHAISTRRTEAPVVDRLAAELASVYDERRRLHEGSTTQRNVREPSEPMRRLRENWRARAEASIVREPLPGDLPTIDRRHHTRADLAAGPVARHVADQMALVELLAYVTAAEQPAVREEVLRILQDSERTRMKAAHVAEQIAVAELTLARIWRLRLVLRSEEVR